MICCDACCIVCVFVYVCRYTLAAMCGKHVHTLQKAKAEDILKICGKKYEQLCASFKTKYPDARVNDFLMFTTLTKLKKVDGKAVYNMSKNVRKACVNDFNRMWASCLGPDGEPPSGKNWDWVSDYDIYYD